MIARTGVRCQAEDVVCYMEKLSNRTPPSLASISRLYRYFRFRCQGDIYIMADRLKFWLYSTRAILCSSVSAVLAAKFGEYERISRSEVWLQKYTMILPLFKIQTTVNVHYEYITVSGSWEPTDSKSHLTISLYSLKERKKELSVLSDDSYYLYA